MAFPHLNVTVSSQFLRSEIGREDVYFDLGEGLKYSLARNFDIKQVDKGHITNVQKLTLLYLV